MRLHRYTDFVNEAMKKGLQLSLFPDMVPHDQPEPEAPTEPNSSAIDQDLLREYLLEMSDVGWTMEFDDCIAKNSPLENNISANDLELTDVLMPGENTICLLITFTNEDQSQTSPADTLYALDNLADEAGYVTYYCKESRFDEIKKREDFEDFDAFLLEEEIFQALCLSKKPFVAKGQDIADYYGWKLKEQSGGPSYVIKDDAVWARMDQIDLAHVVLSSDEEQDDLVDGFDYDRYTFDYDPDYFMSSVLADLDTQAQKALFDKMVGILGLEKLQDLIDSRTSLTTKGTSEDDTMKKLFRDDDMVFRVTQANHLLEVQLILGELCELYTDMVAQSAAEQDSETIQHEFDEIIEKYFTFEKSNERVTFEAPPKKYTLYIYHIKITEEILDWLVKDGCSKADFESSPEEVISAYYYRRHETWKLDIRKSEGWVSTKEFSRAAEKVINAN